MVSQKDKIAINLKNSFEIPFLIFQFLIFKFCWNNFLFEDWKSDELLTNFHSHNSILYVFWASLVAWSQYHYIYIDI